MRGQCGYAAAQPTLPSRTDLDACCVFFFCVWCVFEETSGGAMSKWSQASCVATVDTGRWNALLGVGSVVPAEADTQSRSV